MFELAISKELKFNTTLLPLTTNKTHTPNKTHPWVPSVPRVTTTQFPFWSLPSSYRLSAWVLGGHVTGTGPEPRDLNFHPQTATSQSPPPSFAGGQAMDVAGRLSPKPTAVLTPGPPLPGLPGNS